MLKFYRKWLKDAPIRMKFVPTQVIILLLTLVVGIISIVSVYTLNSMSQVIFTKNVENTERLNEIIRTMYTCRVLGRDILLSDDPEQQMVLYDEYIVAFDLLDDQMDSFTERLSGDKLDTFEAIIQQKNIYKDSMILSSDIQIQGGDYAEALDALTRVTPIANAFFGSIDTFLIEEKALMAEAMDNNDETVLIVFVTVIATNLIAAILVFALIRAFANEVSTSLISLENSVSNISQANNMRTPIPQELFTNDEIGLIANVVDNLRSMLLEHSFKDVLTGGYNATAYHEELLDIFDDKSPNPPVKRFWCLIFDMNNLKVINDSLGHIEGDNAIRSAYRILSDTFSKYGKVFRIGGDEFVAILSGLDGEQVEGLISGLVSKVEEANKNNTQKFSVACGYGEFVGRTKAEFDEHFKVIDKKMYVNKEEIKQAKT